MKRTSSAVTTTISSFSISWTRRVWARKAGIAEPRNCSPSPRPTTSGHSLRAATMMPARRRRPRRTRSGRAGGRRRARTASSSPCSSSCADTRCAMTSASVSDVNTAPCGEELLLELHVVLDDAVDDDVHAVGGVEVRVGVLLADTPVGGPAGVADAGGGGRREHGDAAFAVALLDGRAQLRQVADGAYRLETVLALDRDPGRVVAAVLEVLEAVEEDLLDRTVAHVADDSAHAARFYPRRRAPPREYEGPAGVDRMCPS